MGKYKGFLTHKCSERPKQPRTFIDIFQAKAMSENYLMDECQSEH